MPALLINTNEMGQRLTASLKEATGRDVQISQTAKVDLFPLPVISYSGLTIKNAVGASSPNFLDSSKVTMRFGFSGLLGGSAQPEEVILDGTNIDLEVLPSGRQNWKFDGDGAKFKQYFLNTPVVLKNSMMRYVNASSGARAELNNINGTLQYGENGEVVMFSGDVDIHGHSSPVLARMSSIDLTASEVPDVPLQIVLEHLDAKFTAQGRLSGANKDPEFIGQVKMESPNLWGGLGLFTGRQPVSISDEVEGNEVTAEGNMRLSTRMIAIDNMRILAKGDSSIPAIDGDLDVEYKFGKTSQLYIDSKISTIDVDHLLATYSDWLFADATLEDVKEEDEEVIIYEEPEIAASEFSQFLENLSGSVDVVIDNIIYNGRSLQDIRLTSAIESGRINITEGKATLPGNTKVIVSGMVRDKQEGPTFDGRFEMQGQEMEGFLSLFTNSEVEVPPVNLGRFGVRTNLSVSPSQVRLSEFQTRISDTRVAGSMIFHRGDRLRLESYLRIAGINLDTLMKATSYILPEDSGVQKNTVGQGGEELFNVEYINTRFDWLNSIGIDVDSDFYLQDFVLLDRKGESAKFHLGVGVGSIVISDLKSRYNEAVFMGTYGLKTQPGLNPMIVANARVSEVNMVDIFPNLAQSLSEKEWQNFLDQPFELLNLQTHRADVKLKIGKLNIRSYTFENVDTEMVLENNRLRIERFNSVLWDGKIDARFTIQAGTIPAMSSSFRVNNANLARLSQTTALLKHAAGTVALSGQVSTSGVSPRSWYTNMSGELRVQGRDVSVQGFGIANLARAVPVARTVNDVERAASIAINGGVTRMQNIQGNININEGEANIPQIAFSSPEADGSVGGRVDLIKEAIELNMNFYLHNTVEAGEVTPMIQLHLRGDIDDVKKDLETRELKNYVAQKAAQRALGRTQ
ncbi:MAG: AsmA family protein [Alphaproteobacteria bacterium]|nr:AsmA family protein [Alphaproteobacteria bacterium]